MRDWFFIVLVGLALMFVFTCAQVYNTSEASSVKYEIVQKYSELDQPEIKAVIAKAFEDDYLSNYEYETIKIIVDQALKQKIKCAVNAN